MSDLESRLRDAMETHARQSTFEPTPTSRVAGAARRVRRRRRVTVTSLTAVAVTAAIVVPIVALDRTDDTLPGLAPAPIAADPTSGVNSQNYPPRIDYLAGDTYYAGSGATIVIPEGDPVVGVHALEGTDPTTLVITRDRGDVGLLEWSYLTDGTVDGPICSSSIPVISPGDQSVFSTSRPCPPSSGGEVLSLRSVDELKPQLQEVPLGSKLVAGQSGTVILNSPDQGALLAEFDPSDVDGGASLSATGLASASDFNTLQFESAALSGLLTSGEAAVVRPEGEVIWKRRGVEPSTFSPDGRRLLVRGAGFFEITQATTGKTQATFDANTAFGQLTQVAWDGDRHLVAVVSGQAGEQSLVRLAPGGSVTPLSGTPTLGSDEQFVFDNGPPPKGDGPR